MRYECLLRPMRPTKGPARLLAVSCSTIFHVSGEREQSRVLTLSGWVARLWPGRPLCQTVAAPYEGETAGQFRALLSSLLDSRGTTWIVSDNAVRDLSLLGIWDEIDSHRLYLSGDPVDAAGQRVCPDNREAAPSAILADPPVIVSIRRPGSQGVVKWLSLGNWGCESPDPALPETERVEIVEDEVRMMSNTLDRLGWGGLRMTASGQAAGIWTEHHWTHCPFIHCHEKTLQLEADGVFGGRGECWRIGRVEGPLYQLDVSGMYSYLASTLSLPLAVHTYYPHADPLSVRESGESIGLLARVTLETPEPAYPYRRGWDVIYPVGRFTTVLGGAELRHAAEHGRVMAWHEGATYDLAPFLAATMRGLRAEWDRLADAGEYAAGKWIKRLANSLVGRLARRESSWIGVPDLPTSEPWGEYELVGGEYDGCHVRVLGWSPEVEIDSGFAADAVPAANIWITAAGRQLLWRLMQTCGLDHVYYVYTDEIWTDEIGYERLSVAGEIVPGQWGKLQLKGVHQWAQIDGINTYRTPNGVVCAGIPKRQGQTLTRGDHYRVVESPLAAAHDGRTPQPVEREYEYNPGSVYGHGCILPGGRVEPWVLEE